MPTSSPPVRVHLRRDAKTGAVRALRLVEPPGPPQARLRAARHRMIAHLWPSAPLAPVAIALAASAVDGEAAASATDKALRLHGACPDTVWLDFEEAELVRIARHDAWEGLARLKIRNWRLALRLAPGAPLPLHSQARALFAEMIAPAAHLPRRPGTENPLWVRLLAARATGLLITLGDAGADGLPAFEFDLVENGPEAAADAYPPAARSTIRSAASSLSMR